MLYENSCIVQATKRTHSLDTFVVTHNSRFHYPVGLATSVQWSTLHVHVALGLSGIVPLPAAIDLEKITSTAQLLTFCEHMMCECVSLT